MSKEPTEAEYLQKLHDQHVGAMRVGWLHITDDNNFQFAKMRERSGQVEPLMMDCATAVALIDEYFFTDVPSSEDFRLRLRDAILEDVLASHIKLGRLDACLVCGHHLGKMFVQHLGS